MPNPAEFSFFATCAKSLEALLAEEVSGSGAHSIRQTVAGVSFSGTLAAAYHVCVFSRLANRVILVLQQQPVTDAEALYRIAREVDWDQHLLPGQTLAVRAAGGNRNLTHTQFIAQRVKDAVVDHFVEQGRERPNVSREAPDLLIHAVIKKEHLTLGIDLTGDSLHRRHYRQEQGAAPLKETLAAAVLIRAGWPALCQQESALLYDPLCGAGTLLIEGLLMAYDVAPGLLRQRAFNAWPGHDQAAMAAVLADARARREAAAGRKVRAEGSDADTDIVQKARRNAERAGFYDAVELRACPLSAARASEPPSLLVCNPPYAERLGDEPATMALYRELGQLLQSQPSGTRAAVLTGKPAWGRLLGVHSHKQYALFNGSIPCSLLCFEITDENIYRQRSSTGSAGGTDELDAGAQMLANRLRKNLKNIGRWARQQGHQVYRLYDADMPEYAFAIDLYGERVHMQEYRAPVTVSEADAAERRRQAIQAVQAVLQVPAANINLKMRQRQRGNTQYQAREGDGEDFIVSEGPARFRVNLQRYLDTGLFPDHRPIRHFIREQASGKAFLNLFCYTATATVHAALGGASRSLSVDLSPTYLDWAKKNLALNGINPWHHQLVQTDCMAFLRSNRDHFDLIFLDPPTFSNSKRTSNVLDIQRDHAELIRLCMARLTRSGLLIFSTNSRRFKLDPALTESFAVTDHSRQSIDRDFQRRPDIHQTWLIRYRNLS